MFLSIKFAIITDFWRNINKEMKGTPFFIDRIEPKKQFSGLCQPILLAPFFKKGFFTHFL